MICKRGFIAQNKFEAEKLDMITPGLVLLSILPSKWSISEFSEEEKILL